MTTANRDAPEKV